MLNSSFKKYTEENEVVTKGSLRICKQGHRYYKSSDCPTCPVCEELRNPAGGFPTNLSAPARRALENAGIKTLKQLSSWNEEELLNLHGIGPTTIPKLREVLKTAQLSFKTKRK